MKCEVCNGCGLAYYRDVAGTDRLESCPACFGTGLATTPGPVEGGEAHRDCAVGH